MTYKYSFFAALLIAIPFSALSFPAYAADNRETTFTDPTDAGPDFGLQGEYKGTIETKDGEDEFGAQVIALGNGTFNVVGYYGGLPGDGWKRGDEQKSVEGKAANGAIAVQIENSDIVISDGKITITVDGETRGTLTKIDRQSPTIGEKPPADAIVLFDGTSVDQFDNGQIVDGKWLAATNVATKQKFGDHHLHIEFRTPFMPTARGQGRGNSGVYVQGRYEVQVLDSFGLKGANNECGGIYTIAEPIVNMCLPPLSWQTYDMDFTAARYDDDSKKTANARVTIRQNGVLIHDDLELPHGTPGYHAEGPEPDSIFLQNHGNPVVFRNFWVVSK